MNAQLAERTMPALLPSACSSGQIYVPPGGKMPGPQYNNAITPTGACVDPISVQEAILEHYRGTAAKPNDLWLWIALGVGAIFLLRR